MMANIQRTVHDQMFVLEYYSGDIIKNGSEEK